MRRNLEPAADGRRLSLPARPAKRALSRYSLRRSFTCKCHRRRQLPPHLHPIRYHHRSHSILASVLNIPSLFSMRARLVFPRRILCRLSRLIPRMDLSNRHTSMRLRFLSQYFLSLLSLDACISSISPNRTSNALPPSKPLPPSGV